MLGQIQYSKKKKFSIFLFLSSFSVTTIFKPAPLSTYRFPPMFSDTVYTLYLLRYSLSLLTMQLQAFSSSLNDYIFLLTAPSAIPSCPFAQNDDVRTVFWSQQTCQKQSVQKSPPLSLAHHMRSTYFHSGSLATLISTPLISCIFFQVNSTI